MLAKKILLLILGTLLVPQVALADGGVFPDYTGKVYLPSQKAVVAWDGITETLTLSTKIKIDNLANVGWVVPIPSSTEPEVEEGSIGVFYDLTDLFQSSEKSWTPGVDLEGGEEVEIIDVKEVDIYDVTILRATDASALETWLNENGYLMPEGASKVLEDYCAQENVYSSALGGGANLSSPEGENDEAQSSAVYFVANKVDLANRYLDLEITETDRVCAQEVSNEILLYRSGPALEYQVEVAMEEVEECADAGYEAVRALVELEVGVATPLQITFSPEAPYYPLKMSSINEGETLIDVYVFSAEPVDDGSGVMTLSKMTKNTSAFGESYGLDQEYITYLYFTGDLSELSADAWFESCDYDRDLDPNYTSFGGRVMAVVSVVLSFVLYVAYPVVSLVVSAFAVVGFVVVAKRIAGWFRKRGK